MITVYGFSEERLSMRKTCMFEILLTEKNNIVNIELKADTLSGNGEKCLHRDMIPKTPLEEEKSMTTIVRDDLWF